MRNLLFFLCVILVMFVTVNVFAESSYKDELIDMAEFVSEEQSIETWNVTIKETIEQDKLPQLINKLQRNFSVTTEENKKSIKLIAKDPHKKNNVTEWYNVVIPKNSNQHAQFIVVLKGNHWNDEVKHTYQKRVDDISQYYFTDSKQMFSSLTFIDDREMDKDVLDNMVAEWNMENIIVQSDNNIKNRNVIYGYTPVWQEYIRMQQYTFNIQIAAVPQRNGTTAYTLGTPILINEY